MKIGKSISLFCKTGTLAALAAIIMAGCGTQGNPLGSNTDTEIGTSTPGILTKKKDRETTGNHVDSGQRKRVVKWMNSNNGGEVVLEGRDYRYTLTFPPGALPHDAKIIMELPKEEEAVLDVNFEPHGIHFNKPVIIEMLASEKVNRAKSDDIPTEWVDIYYINEDEGGVWEPQEAEVSIEQGKGKTVWIRARGFLNHFSRYALGGDNPIQKWQYQSYYYGY